ncbi:EamA family transporter RarD [Sphingobium sp. Z007]|uniref:EamA family transporter RarD n=1 Tax=Sphingobium sp. Z007 TaxID=627495 RepID=UPI0020CE2007|nr:EamA family transporter RarD [Sphingobium sp. Z007]
MLAALGAYSIWGLLPIVFKLVHHVGALEVVAQRVIWSLLLLLVMLTVRSGLPALWATLRAPRLRRALAASALLIAANWLIYIWAVNSDHILAGSLGYFLNPLVNVALGMIFLKERLRRGQAIAIAFAAAGVAIMAASALPTLWISISLALSFGLYALVRKVTPVAPMAGLATETLLLAPAALLYVGWLASQDRLSFGQDAGTTTMLVLLGAITTAPLVLFATAAQRLPMATLGVLQYLAPTLQFLCGVFLFGEKLSTGQMASFGLIWLGLILFASDSYALARRNRSAAT